MPDPRLYSEAFTGRARAIARCLWCLEDDHSKAMCPKNPHWPVFGFFPDPSTWLAQAATSAWHPTPSLPPKIFKIGISSEIGAQQRALPSISALYIVVALMAMKLYTGPQPGMQGGEASMTAAD